MNKYKLTDLTPKQIANFCKKYTKTDTCWIWQKHTTRAGYGVYRGVAHRWAWVIANNKDWPDDKPHARHLCNNPSCVNPEHIIPGTAAENIADRLAYERANNIVRPRQTIESINKIKAARAKQVMKPWSEERRQKNQATWLKKKQEASKQ